MKNAILILLLIFNFTFIYAHTPDTLTVTGVALDAETNEAVSAAEVYIDKGQFVLLTKKDGSFSISGFDMGAHVIEIRHIGYETYIKQCHIEADSCLETVFYLTPRKYVTPTVVINSGKSSSKYTALTEKVSILKGNDLQASLGQTIATTLKNETSIAVRSMGPAPARPVVRGLSGSRIMITQDGMNANDLSATSQDHAVTIDPIAAGKIEIIRGPRTLIYSNSVAGGVIDVEKKAVPLEVPSHPEFSGGLFYSSVNNGMQGHLKAAVPLGTFALSGMAGYNKTADIQSPGKVLDNTASDNLSLNIGAGYSVLDFSAGASYDYFDYNYGIPGGFLGGHPNGADIELKKQDINFRMNYHLHNNFLDNAEFYFKRSYYHHTEYESNGSVGAEFVRRMISGKLLLNQKEYEINDGAELNGSYGIDFNYYGRRTGGFVFTPPATSYNTAAFIFEDLVLGSWFLQGAFRLSYDKYMPEIIATVKEPENIVDKEFLSKCFSFSVMKNYAGDFYSGFNIFHSEMPPTLEDLFSEGPHLAAFSYEIGNSSLGKEEGDGAEIFTFYRGSDIYIMITGFYNYFDSYIVARNTGETNYTILLPIYRSEAVEAELYGLEAAVNYHIGKFDIEANVSSVTGNIVSEGENLPMIPPVKGSFEFTYKTGEIMSGMRCDFAGSQTKTDVFETPTDGYAVFGLFANYSFPMGNSYHSITLNLDNIFNTVYRNHLSRIKSIMPEPGRNIRLIYKVFM